jgi:hypothetical protein
MIKICILVGMSTVKKTINWNNIQTGEFFDIVLPERFSNDIPHPIIILGKERIGGMDHYRMISAQPLYRDYIAVRNADLNAPFSIILKSGDEDAINYIFKYHVEGQWKTLVHYGKRHGDKWSNIFRYIFEMKGVDEITSFMRTPGELSTLLETIEKLLKEGLINKRHQNNKLGNIKSKLIEPSELKVGQNYLIESFDNGSNIGSINIGTIKGVNSEDAAKTIIEYFVKGGVPFPQKVTIDSTGKNSESGGSFYFYRRPTIAEAMKDINISPNTMRLLALRTSPGGVGRLNNQFPRAEGPPKPAAKEQNKGQNGGKRKTRRGRRTVKKSRKQRK